MVRSCEHDPHHSYSVGIRPAAQGRTLCTRLTGRVAFRSCVPEDEVSHPRHPPSNGRFAPRITLLVYGANSLLTASRFGELLGDLQVVLAKGGVPHRLFARSVREKER